MEQINWLAVAVAAIMPMIVGFLYYHPKAMGSAWMRVNGFSLDTLTPPKPVLYLVALGLSFLLALRMAADVTGPGQQTAPDGHSYVTFQHGVAHGIINSLLILLPVLGTLSIFEKRGWTWVFVNLGYWVITLVLMCGILSAWR